MGYTIPVRLAPLFEGEGDLGLKRRNGLDIARDIFQVCMNGATKTQIVSAANLNNKRVNRHLKLCVNMNLLTKQFNGGNFIYHTTPTGVRFLRNYFGVQQGENVAKIR